MFIPSATVSKLEHIPQFKEPIVKGLFDVEVENVFMFYLSLLDKFVAYSERQLSDISQIEKRYLAVSGTNSASKNTLCKIASALIDQRQEFVNNCRSVVSSADSSEQKETIFLATANAMVNAHNKEVETFEITGRGYDFFDGDIFSDSVRWTYLHIKPNNIFEVEPYIHYFAAHAIDMICVAWLKANLSVENIETNNLDTKKDGALNILSTVMCVSDSGLFDEDRKHDDLLSRTLQIWCTQRDAGGLGWIPNIFQESFETDLHK